MVNPTHTAEESHLYSSGNIGYRASWEELHEQIAAFNRKTQLSEALERDHRGIMILNPYNQIIYCNQTFLDLTRKNSRDDIYALRPGEVLGCVNAQEGPAGCGTSQYCNLCNIYLVIREIQKGKSFAGRENIHVSSGQESELITLKVSGSPIKIGNEVFSLVIISAS